MNGQALTSGEERQKKRLWRRFEKARICRRRAKRDEAISAAPSCRRDPAGSGRAGPPAAPGEPAPALGSSQWGGTGPAVPAYPGEAFGTPRCTPPLLVTGCFPALRGCLSGPQMPPVRRRGPGSIPPPSGKAAFILSNPASPSLPALGPGVPPRSPLAVKTVRSPSGTPRRLKEPGCWKAPAPLSFQRQ